MGSYYLAVDIGASSGRHILAHREGGRMVLEEIYRFPNGMTEQDGSLVWDVDRLFAEIKEGMRRCVEQGKIPESMGIDTWAVDYVLLDRAGKRLGPVYAYRDSRTEGMDEEVRRIVREEELYGMTGIQKQSFNTIYQLMAVKKQHPEYLKETAKLLMIPDYFHYLLTGVAAAEYTNATTTQLVSPITKTWNMNLIEQLGFPRHMFQTILLPGSSLGDLTEEIQKEVGFNCRVVLPATHDTASAVMAVPSNQKNTLYISSGTWSLMGTELMTANCSPESRALNLTNEGGYDYRFRYLKNIMGLWMIQSVKKEIGQDMSFGTICELASRESIGSLVDCNDKRFLAPESMVEEVQAACRESGQQVPEGTRQVAAVIYNSLAQCYQKTAEEISHMTDTEYDEIYIVGGGANASYLNRLTAAATGKRVYAGPTEATAVGNIAAQMIGTGEFLSLQDARVCIRHSFQIETYEP